MFGIWLTCPLQPQRHRDYATRCRLQAPVSEIVTCYYLSYT